MRLSTSTNLFGVGWNKAPYTDTVECLRRCRALGFEVMDMNFCPMVRGETALVGDDWLRVLSTIREEAERLGMTFSQSHIPIYPDLNAGPIPEKLSFYEQFMEWTRRAILGSGILGVKWAVAHPYTNTRTAECDREANLKMNLEFYKPVVELAKTHNVGIALENMLENHQPQVKRRFCATADELIALVDEFDDPAVGICWDFGHANTMYVDQALSLRKVGKRLKATHVADNKGVYDSHTAPFVEGSVDWNRIMPLLVEIGYEGDFTFEIQWMTNNMPDFFRDEIAGLCYKIGLHCLSLAK
jgi:sugar phosphate isomerase/epimerase